MDILRSCLGNQGMHQSTLISLVIAIAAQAQQCNVGTAIDIKGNWYCSAVDSISYTNFPGNGHYNRVIHMDTATGECTMDKHFYSGSLSPLNEEVSVRDTGVQNEAD